MVNFSNDLLQKAWNILGWRLKNDTEYKIFLKTDIVIQHPLYLGYESPYCKPLKTITGEEFLLNLGNCDNHV